MPPFLLARHCFVGGLIAFSLLCGARPAQPVTRLVVLTDARPNFR